MRIIHVNQTRYGQQQQLQLQQQHQRRLQQRGVRWWPWLLVVLLLLLLESAAMESSAELQANNHNVELLTLPTSGAIKQIQRIHSSNVHVAVAGSITSEIHRNRPDPHSSYFTSSSTNLHEHWKSTRTKVKRRQRLNSQSNLPASTSNLGSPTNLSSWQQQRYLKVNQVFESERRMSHDEIQRNHGKIVLLGLFELSTKRGPRPDGLSELVAATMAVEHINRKQLLPGYTLELVTNDTQVSVSIKVPQ